MKTILITGSTDGIGKLTALKLAKEGHSLLVHGRNAEKVDALIAAIKATSNNDNIKGFIADFSDLTAVNKMAQEIKEQVLKIDVLINNAGVFKSAQDHTKEGLDLRMTVNYLAPYLLTQELLVVMKNATDPRIINLSSAAQAPVSEAVLVGNERVSQSNSYAQSKLALTMWSFYLAKKEPNIVVIAVNPGSLLNTKMAKAAYGQFWSPAEKGVHVLYDLSISERHKSHSAEYFDNDQGSFSPAHPDAYDQNKIDQLISNTHKILTTII